MRVAEDACCDACCGACCDGVTKAREAIDEEKKTSQNIIIKNQHRGAAESKQLGWRDHCRPDLCERGRRSADSTATLS